MIENSKSFTDQKPRITTEHDLVAKWGLGNPGERLRCYLCGYKFKLGDTWRWVYMGGHAVINFMTCQKCDGDDVKERWLAMNKEFKERFWVFNDRE